MKLFIGVFLSFSGLVSAGGLEGKWQGPCEPASQGYTQDELTFTGEQFELLTLHHGNGRCQKPDIRIETTGTFAEPEDYSSNLDFTVGATYMTPLTAGIAVSLNIARLCGVTGWKAKQKRDVSGLTCDGAKIPEAGDVRYDIYGFDGEALLTGLLTETNNGETSDTRPTELNTDRPYVKSARR